MKTVSQTLIDAIWPEVLENAGPLHSPNKDRKPFNIVNRTCPDSIYILPILAGAGVLTIDGGRPNKVWLNL
jgi:hypothetical protein